MTKALEMRWLGGVRRGVGRWYQMGSNVDQPRHQADEASPRRRGRCSTSANPGPALHMQVASTRLGWRDAALMTDRWVALANLAALDHAGCPTVFPSAQQDRRRTRWSSDGLVAA